MEGELSAGPVGQWEHYCEEFEALVLRVEGPAFARARADGNLLSVAEAAGLETAPTG